MYSFRRGPCLSVLAALVWAGITANAHAAVNVPPGFEDLARGQQLWLDVSLYGEPMGLFQVKVDLDNVTFQKPDDLMAIIKEKYNNDPALARLLAMSLRAPLKRNDNLSCKTTGKTEGCDFIVTKTVAVIYDENNARLSLFLPAHYLPREHIPDIYYQATPESSRALIHQQNLNFVADQDFQSASVQGNGTLGVTQNGYANLDWLWQGQRYRTDSQQRAQVNNAYFRQDFLKRMYVQGGVMDSRDIFSNAGGNINLSLLPIGRIQGLRTGSTQAWVNQSQVSRGTPVTVFLSKDSRVDAYRNGQLLSSFYLKAGMQKLDTRAFPTGSYTVTLRIYESNQLVRTQTVPYTGTGDPQQNTFEWFIQGGRLDTEEGYQSEGNSPVIQGGLRIPVSTGLSLTLGSTVLKDVQYYEAAADWNHGFSSGPLDGLLTSRASFLYGSDGSRGNMQQVTYSDGFSLSFYRSAMMAPDCDSSGDSQHYGSYSGCSESTSLTFSVPVHQWYLNLGYSLENNQGRYVYRNQLPVDDEGVRDGAPWDRIYFSRYRSQTWQAGISRYFSVAGININSNLNAFVRNNTGYTAKDKGIFLNMNMSFNGNNGVNGRHSTSSLGASWQHSQRDADRVGYNMAYSRYMDEGGENELGAAVSGINTDSSTLSAYARSGGQLGNGSLTVSDAWNRDYGGHSLSASGNYSSSVALGQGGFYWGRWGDGTPSSAFTVGVDTPEDEGEGARVNVAVDGSGQANVRGNSRALFTVPGFRESTLRVTESVGVTEGAGSAINRGAGTRSVFMQPGRMYRRDVGITTHYTWLGRMLDSASRPLEGGIPLNVASWTPLGQGGFLMETTQLLKVVFVMKDSEFWRCGLKVKSMRDVVRWTGTSLCTNTTMAKLPEREQKQVQLMAVRKDDRDAAPVAANQPEKSQQGVDE